MPKLTAPGGDGAAGGSTVPEQRLAVEATLRRYQYRQDALIEVLHTAQRQYGYLSREVLWYIARQLRLPPSKVYGVATFYHFFTLEPPGLHTAVVCEGTACYLRGAGGIAAALRRRFGVEAGRTTHDGKLTLATARCLGMSALAPVVTVDGTVLSRTTAEAVIPQVQAVLGGSSSAPVNGSAMAGTAPGPAPAGGSR